MREEVEDWCGKPEEHSRHLTLRKRERRVTKEVRKRKEGKRKNLGFINEGSSFARVADVV